MRISDWSSDVCSSDLWQLPSKAIDNPSCVSERRADLARGEIGIGRERDRAADDDDRGARVERGARGDDALLIAGRAVGGADAGHDEEPLGPKPARVGDLRSEAHTSELQSLMRISYSVS